MDTLSQRMPSRLLTEWMTYETIEPFGEWRADVRSAIIAAVVANANRGKNDKVLEVEDFMPNFEPKPTQSVDDMIAIAAQITANLGGRVDL